MIVRNCGEKSNTVARAFYSAGNLMQQQPLTTGAQTKSLFAPYSGRPSIASPHLARARSREQYREGSSLDYAM